MAAPDTEKPPSPWAVIDDFSKNVVTLASALLGLTVTFASQLIGKTDAITRWTLFAAWILSVFTIASGVASHGFVVSYLKNGTCDKLSVFFANAAFYALLASALAFAVFGKLAVESKNGNDATAIVEKAISSMPRLSGDKNSMWTLKSLTLDTAKGTYELVVIKENSSETFSLILNSEGEITKANKP